MIDRFFQWLFKIPSPSLGGRTLKFKEIFKTNSQIIEEEISEHLKRW